MSNKNFYLKYNNKTAHWFGRAKLKLLDTEDFSKEIFFDDVQDILTGTKFGQSTSGRKKNPYLLQEVEEKESKEANADADVNVE